MIRGRKYYWHIPKAKDDESVYSTTEKTKRNATFELLKPESTFSFKVYYDSLDENQVNMLAWTLTLGGNQSMYMHKLGHGKPLGLGSVKITIKQQVERTVMNGEYHVKRRDADGSLAWEAPGYNPVLIDAAAQERFLVIAEFDRTRTTDICYPYVYPDNEQVRRQIETTNNKNALGNHQWFKKAKDEGIKLPHIGENVTMKARKTVSQEDSYSGRHNNRPHGGYKGGYKK